MSEEKQGVLLLVDDEKDLIQSLKLILEDVCGEIHTALDGVEGLEVLKNHHVDVIVSDINMPRMNGVEFIKHAREQGYKKPFIFYTAHGNDELMLEVSKFGTYDFLNKPNLYGLEEVVERAMQDSLDGYDADGGQEMGDDDINALKGLLDGSD